MPIIVFWKKEKADDLEEDGNTNIGKMQFHGTVIRCLKDSLATSAVLQSKSCLNAGRQAGK